MSGLQGWKKVRAGYSHVVIIHREKAGKAVGVDVTAHGKYVQRKEGR